MKRCITIVTAACLLMICGSVAAVQDAPLRVETADFPILINRAAYTPDMPVVTVDDYTYLPLRCLGTALHRTVTWNEQQRQVEITSEKAGEQQAVSVPEPFDVSAAERADFPILSDGAALSIERPVVTIEGFTYLPLKAIGDALGIPVYWNATLSRVEITLPPDPIPTEPVEGLDNLAYQKPMSASDSWNDSYYPKFAADMDLATRWASRKTEFMWLCVDLEEAVVFDTVKLYDYKDRTENYEILVSADNVNFMRVAGGEKLSEQGTQIDFSPVKARYVRAAFTGAQAVSIYSFEVYNRSGQTDAPEVSGETFTIETPAPPMRTPRPAGIPAPTPNPQRPDLIAYANPENGTADFKELNTEPGGSIEVVDDPIYGKVFQFHKNIGANRNEVHGLKGLTVEQDKTYYLGWRYKVDMPQELTTNAWFQWKAYAFKEQVNPMLQNYPITINPTDGQLGLMQFNPVVKSGERETLCWDIPFAPNEWHDYVLAIHVSDDTQKGWISFYYDGELQVLNNGETKFYCRTFDCDYVDPKWGIYGGRNTEISSWLADLRVASTYESAAPEKK